MNLRDFQEAVYRELGPHLEHATRDKVREFSARMQSCLYDRWEGGRYLLAAQKPPEPWKQIVKEFLGKVLYDPPERAVMVLWLTALELWWEVIAQDLEEPMAPPSGEEINNCQSIASEV